MKTVISSLHKEAINYHYH